MPDVDPCLCVIEPGWRGVEIGVAGGDSALALLRYGVGFLYLVDPWEDHEDYLEGMTHKRNFRLTVGRVAPFAGRYEILRTTSSDAVPHVPVVDFVWVDGNHRYEWVLADLRDYWPKVRSGGVICGHDYNDCHPGSCEVKKAVDEFFGALGLGLLPEVVYPCWAVRKP